MKFVLFVEGHTEHKAIPSFLKRWLDPKLSQPVGIQSIRFNGWPELVKDAPVKARLYLSRDDVIPVIALLDLYGPTIYPQGKKTPDERYVWAKHYLEKKVGLRRFFQFFAVHEVEAWLFSDPSVFPSLIRTQIAGLSQYPERVNGANPPAKRLNNFYQRQTGRGYKKVVYGKDLFSKLDPDVAYGKCPRLKDILDKMLALAESAC